MIMDFRINETYGWLDARFDSSVADLKVRYYTVHRSARRRGFGAKLLHLALDAAVDLEARSISGSLTSRESVVVAQKVFGP